MNETSINQVFDTKSLLRNKQIQFFIIPLLLQQKALWYD